MVHTLDFPQTRTQLEGLVGEIPDEVWTSFTTYLALAMRKGADLDSAVADAVALCDSLRRWAARGGRRRRQLKRVAAMVAVCAALSANASSDRPALPDTRPGHRDLVE